MHGLNSLKDNIITAVILAFIFALGFLLRAGVYERSAVGPFTPFTNINAFHYYFADLAAKGGKIPEICYEIQYPEGFEVFRRESVIMEYFVGFLYRIFGRSADFGWFVRNFVIIFGLIPLFMVYALARRITKARGAAILAALFYTIAPAAINRSIGLGFMKETFALPFIFGNALFMAFAEDETISLRKVCIYSVFSGVCMFIALAAWHFTQFYLMIVFVFAAYRGIFLNKRDTFAQYIALAVSAIAAGLLIPYLRSIPFLMSTPMLLGFAVLPVFYFKKFIKSRGALAVIFAATTAILIFGFSFLSRHFSIYHHVYSLGIDSLRFLGRKPFDPNLLSSDSRMLWDVAHSAPALNEALAYFLPALVLGLPLIIITAGKLLRGKTNAGDGGADIVLYLLAVFGILYLFVNRVMVFTIFFLSVWTGGLAVISRKRLQRGLLSAFIIVVIALELIKVSHARA